MWPYAIVLLAVVLVVVMAVLLIKHAPSRIAAGWGRRIDDAIEAVGPKRCEIAIEIITGMARSAPKGAIPELWRRLELPLLQALPDCPPPIREQLGEALEALHAATAVRDIQRSVMELRSSLRDEGDDLPDPRAG